MNVTVTTHKENFAEQSEMQGPFLRFWCRSKDSIKHNLKIALNFRNISQNAGSLGTFTAD